MNQFLRALNEEVDELAMTPLAQSLKKDTDGSVRNDYAQEFEQLRQFAVAKLRDGVPTKEYQFYQNLLEISETAISVVERVWGRFHKTR